MSYRRWGLLITVLVCCLFGIQRFASVPVIETLGTLLLGWWRFLARVLPQQEVNWSGVGTAAICVVLLAGGMQWFLRWFYAAWRSNTEEQASTVWRFRWTAYMLGLMVLTFAAGTAFVGVVHQATWLATSPEPRTTMAPDLGVYLSTSNSLKQIHLGIASYSSTFSNLQHVSPDTHSWITVMLPYMAINPAYDFSKPWNDPANAAAYRRPIIEFLKGDVREDIRTKEGYAVSHFAGNKHVFARESDAPVRLEDLPGATLLVGEAAGNLRAWADPANVRDPLIGIATSPESFGNVAGTGAYYVEASGAVKFINRDVAPEVLQAISGYRGNPSK